MDCLNLFLNRLSFVKKFVLLFIFSIAFPVLIQNMVYYLQTEKNIQEEMLGKINEALDDKAEKLNAMFSDLLSLAREYYQNENLYWCLDQEYGRDLDYLIRYQETLQTLFSGNHLQSYHIRNMAIYSNNDTLFNGAFIRKLAEPDPESLGENLAYLNMQPVEGENKIYFRVSEEAQRLSGVSDSRSLSIVCILDYYMQYGAYDEVLQVELDQEYLLEVLRESNLFENMFLTDTNGRVLSAANDYSNTGTMGIFQEENAEEGMLVLSRELSGFPLTLYGIYDARMISREFSQSRTLSIIISLICLLFAMAFVYAVAGNINRRLRRLIYQSEEIARGNFIQSETAAAGRDEFSVLESSMNSMSAQLKDLIEREYKAELARAEQEKETNQAKFLALQSQVNPHFMFNALESIRLKALVKGETETAGVIRDMARMFRHLIEWENNVIPLEDEIRFLDEFLHIQIYRFEDEFSYEIDVTDQASSCLVPKLILQPLVENACVHGVEAVADNRWVRIAAYVQDDMLHLTVEDNGGGMPPEKLEELRGMLKGERPAGRSVGLWNVSRRLHLYYGNDYKFEIDSVQAKGTSCRIYLPTGKIEKGKDEGICTG